MLAALAGLLANPRLGALEELPEGFRMSGTTPALLVEDLRWVWNGDDDDNRVSVPVKLLAGSAVDYVQFSIDYDPGWLELERVRILAPAADDPDATSWYLSAIQPVAVNAKEGRVTGIALRPGGAPPPKPGERSSGETLFYLDFKVAVEFFPGGQNRLELGLDFTPFDPASLTQEPQEETLFGDLEGDEDEGSVDEIAGHLVDGDLEILYDDGVEIGGGRLTARAQEIVLPIYATRLSRTDLITTGVDYDELILRTRRIRSRGRGRVPGADLTVREVPFTRTETGIVFQLAIESAQNAVGDEDALRGRLLREHVADIHLLYEGPISEDPLASAVHRGVVGATFGVRGTLLEENEDGLLENRGVALPGELEISEAWFVRGNVNSSITAARNEEPGYPRGESAAFVASRVAPTLGDGLQILEWLFRRRAHVETTSGITCAEAADTNDDGEVSLNDAILLFHFLYTGGVEPASPFPTAGPDSSAAEGGQGLGCEQSLPVFTGSSL